MGKSKIIETHIHVYRARKRMSQGELAEKTGVSRVTIINIGLNRQNPSVITMYDISRVLETSIKELFTFGTPEEE